MAATIEELESKLQSLENRKQLSEWYNGKFLGMIQMLESQKILTEDAADKLRGVMSDFRAFGNQMYYDLKQIYDENLTYRKDQEEDKKIQRRGQMQKIIISMPGCSKCAMLKDQCKDTKSVEVPQDTLLAFARAVGIQSMPFVIVTGDPQELEKEIKG